MLGLTARAKKREETRVYRYLDAGTARAHCEGPALQVATCKQT